MAEDHPQQTTSARWNRGHEEIVVAAVFLVVTVVFRLNVDTFVSGRQGSFLGPTFWPGALLTLGIALSAIYLVTAIIAVRRGPPSADDETSAPTPAPVATEGDSPAASGSVLKLVVGFVLVGAYIYLLRPIGFVPATVLFSVAFLFLVGERRWWVLGLFPVAAVTLLLGMFTQLLVVSLPRGNGIFLTLSTYLY